jgi:hypothetical protein
MKFRHQRFIFSSKASPSSSPLQPQHTDHAKHKTMRSNFCSSGGFTETATSRIHRADVSSPSVIVPRFSPIGVGQIG